VTFNGVNFDTDHNKYSILIDDIACSVGPGQATPTAVSCTTSARTGAYEYDATLSIHIDGIGYVATQGHVYRYVSLWSSDSTWGGLFKPIDGESVAITKGTHLLVDI
jgi:hypothetical protein